MATTASAARVRMIERRVVTAHSRDTLTKALYDVLIEAIDFGPRDLPLSEDREWIRGAVAVPLQEATDVALHALIWNVAEAFERAPDRIRDRFDRSHEGEDLGWE
jgi:hypothetical protein